MDKAGAITMTPECFNEKQHPAEEYIPLSYIAQYLYCARRAGLILLEQQWDDNIHTVEGALQHEHVHVGSQEIRGDIIRLTRLPVISERLGLSGICDSVELIADIKGIKINGFKGKLRVVPVEHKHGVRRDELEYEAQICSQAICLEEMWGCIIDEGFIFYASERRRKKIVFTEDLRSRTEEAARHLHVMLSQRLTPKAIKTRRCKGCSLREKCIPELNRNLTPYIWELIEAAKGDDEL